MKTLLIALACALGACSQAHANFSGPGFSKYAALPGGIAYKYAGDATHNANNTTLEATGFNGDLIGGMKLSGWIQTIPANTGLTTEWVLAPNDDTTLQTTTGAAACSIGTCLVNVPFNTAVNFQFTVTCTSTKSGNGSRVFAITTIDSGGASHSSTATWTNTTDPIISFRLKSEYSDGSIITVQTMDTTVTPLGQPPQMTWAALGN